jgi:Zn-dependent protease/CBS domain-containing protein
MGRRLRLGSLYGVDVAIDWSWIVTFVLAAWTIVSVTSAAMPFATPGALTLVATLATTTLFGSLAFHELVHAAVARASGVPVRRVTMFLFGGITDVEREPASPRTEAIAAVAAPAANGALGVFGILAGTALHPVPAYHVVSALLVWAGVVNLGIALVNLLPAYPLDGGRLVRALVWHRTGDVERATRVAAWGGQVIGWLVLVLGVAVAFAATGSGVPLGLWLAFMGWFLASAGAQAYEGVVQQGALAGVTVGALLRHASDAVPADVTVQTAVRGWLSRAGNRALPVVDGDRFLGVVSMRDLRGLSTLEWRSTAVAELARHDDQEFAAPWEDAIAALNKLGALDADRMPVVAGGRLVGVVLKADIAQWLAVHAGGSHTLGPIPA